MKTVMIVDDELLVRIGLKVSIPWEEHGYRLVGDAQNGKEALTLFDQYEPDIVITDIVMPTINGLQLMGNLRKRKPNIQFVILTNHQDFDYAKEAIKLGAAEYMLKSDITAQTMIDTLERLPIDRGEKSDKSIAEPYDWRSMLSDIMRDTRPFSANVMTLFKSSGITFEHSCFAVACCSFQQRKDLRRESEKRLHAAASSIKHYGTEPGLTYVSLELDGTFIIIVNIDEDSSSKTTFPQHAGAFLQRACNNIEQLLGISVTIGVSGIHNSLMSLPQMLFEAGEAVEKSFFCPTKITLYSQVQNASDGIAIEIDHKEFRSFVVLQEKQKVMAYVGSLFSRVKQTLSKDAVKVLYIDLLSFAKQLVHELKLERSAESIQDMFSYSYFESHKSIDAAFEHIQAVFGQILAWHGQSQPAKYSYYSNRTIAFIKENYTRNITLTDIANHVGVSNSYLSYIFKKETNQNLTAYLINMRVEKAKHLLLNSNLKIYEVATKVGYENPYYFSRVFKEFVGMSCKEFRDTAQG